MSDWSTNITIEALAAWLKTCKRVVVLTHVKPDGDAAGATLAAARALAMAGVEATPWYFGPLQDWVAEIAAPTKYVSIDEYGLPAAEPDGILILDTGSWSQLHDVADWLRERHDIAAVIDHHVQGDPGVAPRRHIVTAAAAVCQPVAELCCLLLGKSCCDELPVELAEPLYLGIATDTGWFRHSNVTRDVMRLAGSLVAAGVDHARLYRLIEQQHRASRLRLMGRALGSLELLDRDRIAIQTLSQKDFHDCRAASTDTSGFVDLPLSVASVVVSVFLTESFTSPKDNPHDTFITKVSFRSKDGDGAVDVNAIAKKLGGGGHVRAAGAKLSLPLADARRRVIEALS